LKASAIARAILSDREQQKPEAKCFWCGKSYRYLRGGGAFCGEECRTRYDIEHDILRAFTFDPFKYTKWRVVVGGNPGYLVATPMTRVATREREDGKSRGGWRLECAGCGRQFESLGLRYCKPECRGREEARKLMAEVGMTVDNRRPCQRCGKPIPRWRNGRAVRADAKMCGRC
jgi:hypothetical protein